MRSKRDTHPKEGGPAVVILLPILSLLAGSSTALAASHQLRRTKRPWNGPYLVGVVLFVVFLLWPGGLYLFLTEPAWSTLYWYSAATLPLGLVLTIMLGCPLLAAAGFLLTALFNTRETRWPAWAGFGVLLTGGLVWLLSSERMARWSATGDWQDGTSLLSGQIGTLLAFAIPIVLGGWAGLLALYAVEGHRLQRSIAAKSRPGGKLSAPASTALNPVKPAPFGPPPRPVSSAKNLNLVPEADEGLDAPPAIAEQQASRPAPNQPDTTSGLGFKSLLASGTTPSPERSGGLPSEDVAQTEPPGSDFENANE